MNATKESSLGSKRRRILPTARTSNNQYNCHVSCPKEAQEQEQELQTAKGRDANCLSFHHNKKTKHQTIEDLQRTIATICEEGSHLRATNEQLKNWKVELVDENHELEIENEMLRGHLKQLTSAQKDKAQLPTHATAAEAEPVGIDCNHCHESTQEQEEAKPPAKPLGRHQQQRRETARDNLQQRQRQQILLELLQQAAAATGRPPRDQTEPAALSNTMDSSLAGNKDDGASVPIAVEQHSQQQQPQQSRGENDSVSVPIAVVQQSQQQQQRQQSFGEDSSVGSTTMPPHRMASPTSFQLPSVFAGNQTVPAQFTLFFAHMQMQQQQRNSSSATPTDSLSFSLDVVIFLQQLSRQQGLADTNNSHNNNQFQFSR